MKALVRIALCAILSALSVQSALAAWAVTSDYSRSGMESYDGNDNVIIQTFNVKVPAGKRADVTVTLTSLTTLHASLSRFNVKIGNDATRILNMHGDVVATGSLTVDGVVTVSAEVVQVEEHEVVEYGPEGHRWTKQEPYPTYYVRGYFTIEITYEDRKPDVAVVGLKSVPAKDAAVDEPISLSFAIRNKGGVPSAATRAYVYDGPRKLREYAIPALGAETGESKIDYTLPALSVGSHELRVSVDPDPREMEFTRVDNVAIVPMYVYRRTPYKVAFHANDGSDTVLYQNFVCGTEQALMSNPFTRAHYDFRGWSTSSTGTAVAHQDGERVRNLTYVENAVLDLYAVWDVRISNVVCMPGDRVVIRDESGTRRQPEYLSVGTLPDAYSSDPYSDFIGWFSDQVGGTQLQPSCLARGVVYAYSHCAPKSSTISFVSGAGVVGVMPDEVFYGFRGIPLPACTLTKSGCYFAGWARSTDLDKVLFEDQAQCFGGDLYPVWHPVKRLTFLPDGGSGSMSDLEVKSDAAVVLPACTFTKFGHLPLGWRKQETTVNPQRITWALESKFNPLNESDTTYCPVWMRELAFDGPFCGDLKFAIPDEDNCPWVAKDGFFQCGNPAVGKRSAMFVLFRPGTTGILTYQYRQRNAASRNNYICFEGAPTYAGTDTKWIDRRRTISGTTGEIGCMEVAYVREGNDSWMSWDAESDSNGSFALFRPIFFYVTQYEKPSGRSEARIAVAPEAGWKISSDSWIHLTPDPADGRYGKFVVDANAGLYPRTGTFTINGDITVSVVQEASPFVEVVFNPLQGEMAEKSVRYAVDGRYSSLPVPTYDNHVFDGWWTAPTGGKRVRDGDPVSSVARLYARWKPVRCTVTFDACGGTCPTASAEVDHMGTLASLPTPSRTGYAFGGWCTGKSVGVVYAAGASVTVAGSLTLYALWDTRGYVPVGASAVAAYPITPDSTVRSGSLALVRAHDGERFVDTGTFVVRATLKRGRVYTFAKPRDAAVFAVAGETGGLPAAWHATADGLDYVRVDLTGLSGSGTVEYLVVFSGAVGARSTLYWTEGNLIPASAQWTSLPSDAAFKLEFDANDGRGVVNSRNAVHGKAVGALPVPVRSGYAFDGWWTAATGGGRVTASTVMVTYDVRLYAHWAKIEMGSGLSTAYSITPNATVASSPLTLVRSFDGTRLGDDGTIVAKATLQRGRVYTFAKPQDAAELLVTGSGANLPEAWYATAGGLDYVRVDLTGLSGSGTVEYTIAFFGTVGIRTMLYWAEGNLVPASAQWTDIPPDAAFRLEFDANDGRGVVNSRNAVHGKAVGALPVPVRSGYVFAGWWTAANGGVRVTPETKMVTYDVRLYAHWGRIETGAWTGSAYPLAPDTTVRSGNLALVHAFDGEALLDEGAFYAKATLKRGCVYTFAKPHGDGATLAVAGSGLPAAWYATAGNLDYVLIDLSGLGGSGTVDYYAVFSGAIGARSTLYWAEGNLIPASAQWTSLPSDAAFKLEFDANDGRGVVNSWKAVHGKAVGALPVLTRSGYVFDGWWTAAEGGGRVTSETKMVTYDVRLYAHWTQAAPGSGVSTAYSIVPNAAVASSPVTLVRSFDGERFGNDGTIVAKATLQRGRVYTFAKPQDTTEFAVSGSGLPAAWYAADDGLDYALVDLTKLSGAGTVEYLVVFSGAIGVRTALYWAEGNLVPASARWTYLPPDAAFRLEFDGNDGYGIIETRNAVHGKAVGALPVPTRSGYAFDGWWTSETGGERVIESTVMVTYDVRLYAHWVKLVAGSCAAAPAEYFANRINKGLQGAGKSIWYSNVEQREIELVNEYSDGRYTDAGVLYMETVNVMPRQIYTLAKPRDGVALKISCGLASLGLFKPVESQAQAQPQFVDAELEYYLIDLSNAEASAYRGISTSYIYDLEILFLGDVGARTTLYWVKGNHVPEDAKALE